MPTGEPRRMDWVASVVGWGSSVVLHALLLISFTGITWWSGVGRGSHARQVALVLDDVAAIEFSDTSLDAADLASFEPSLPDAAEPTSYDPIANLGSGELSGNFDDDMTLDVPSGGGGAMGADMEVFLPGGGAGAEDRLLFGPISDTGEAVVYVIDRSESMMLDRRLDDAKWELQESVRRLAPHQKFYIIFYSTDATPMHADGLVAATPGNKDRYLAWAQNEIQPTEWTNPIPALRKALSLKPDVIYLLTDGAFTPRPYTLISEEEVCDAIRLANPKAGNVLQTSINTIGFHVDGLPAEIRSIIESVLMRIARENDGTYRSCNRLSRR